MGSHHERGPVIDPAADSIERKIMDLEKSRDKPDFGQGYVEDKFAQSDNINLSGPPIAAGKLKWKSFLVSFMVDARGGAMRGCRHSGVRVIIPPRKAPMPMRVTCRYLKKDKLIHPPPLMEGEAIASRILELGPSGAKFLGPVIIEVPHFAALRGKEREIVILRSDNGETWKEHTLEATEEAVQEVLQDSFDEGEATQLEDLNTNRITRILTTDFPQYFAIISRIRQEVHAIGPEGGVVNSTVVPQVQAVFPQGALTKKIKVGLQAQPIPPELTAKLLGNRVAVSPIVTVEPRRRKFHKPITLTIPVPVAASKGMINQYSGDTPTLRLLCSITGGTTRAQWEDVTGSTPLTFVNDCVNFTTTVSARFWLMDCRNVGEATKMATSLYKEAIYVPFMAKFCVFSKRHEMLEARMRVFCMTDDKEEKTLEHQEHFHEVAKSRDVEVMEGKTHHLEFYGNLFPVTKSGEQLSHKFHAFRENRLPFTVRVKDNRKCKLCHKVYSDRIRLELHMRVHNNLKPFPCTVCEKAFTQKRSLKEHLLTHDTVRHYECRHCEKKFVQKNHLKYHLASQHAETTASEVRHQCAVCNKIFPFPYQLRKHVAVHGSKSAEKQLQCRCCLSWFSSPALLQEHSSKCSTKRSNSEKKGAWPKKEDQLQLTIVETVESYSEPTEEEVIPV